MARALEAPLDVYVVRKLGVPGQEELALGAIASGGVRVLDQDVVRAVGIDEGSIDAIAAREQAELARREALYRGDRKPPAVAGRTVVLVDDGLATGASMRAALSALRAAGATSLVVGVPVGSVEAVRLLRPLVDDLVCLRTPRPFLAVGVHYVDFSAVAGQFVLRGEAAYTFTGEPATLPGGVPVSDASLVDCPGPEMALTLYTRHGDWLLAIPAAAPNSPLIITRFIAPSVVLRWGTVSFVDFNRQPTVRTISHNPRTLWLARNSHSGLIDRDTGVPYRVTTIVRGPILITRNPRSTGVRGGKV